jgi:hypothetical protein
VRRSPGLSTGLGSGALGRQPDSLADVLERVLDKGIVIVGDVVVNLLDIELLTLKLRLFVSSAETAREMGLDWWTRDPFFSGRGDGSGQNRSVENRSDDDEVRALHDRIAVLEDELRRQGRELPSAARQEEGDHDAR